MGDVAILQRYFSHKHIDFNLTALIHQKKFNTYPNDFKKTQEKYGEYHHFLYPEKDFN